MNKSLLKKGPLTWIAIGILLFAGIIGMISREMKRQRGRALTARSESAMEVTAATTSDVRMLPMSDAAHAPAPLGVRYPHRQMAIADNQIAVTYELGDGTRSVLAYLNASSSTLEVNGDNSYGYEMRQPTLAGDWQDDYFHFWLGGIHYSETDRAYLEWTGFDKVSAGLSAGGMVWYRSEGTAFPNLAALGKREVMTWIWTDKLGASGFGFEGLKELHDLQSLPRSADWQTWQPPDIRFIDDDHIAMVLRAEAQPRMSGSTREVDSAILGWRFPLDGPVPEPEILMPAIPGQFTERPVLASDRHGNLAVAIGHWGPAQPQGLRGYEMTILLAEGMGEWRTVAPPIPDQVNIATAQPQLGRIGDSLLLVYALEVNEIQTPTAHRIQWVRSTDAGKTWTVPALLLPDIGLGIRDYPLDLIMDDSTATLLLQRQTPAPERKDSIVVDAPTVAMFAAQWEWGE